MTFSITNGPFSGTVVSDNELTRHQRDNELEPVVTWGVHHRTRVFLEKFDIRSGWRVEVGVRDPGILMEDLNTLDANNRPIPQPTREFIATLVDTSGAVFASCSVLKIINSENAWKAGVTGARAGLYEACGLSGSMDPQVNPDDDSRSRKSSPIKTVDLPSTDATSADAPLVVTPAVEDEEESVSADSSVEGPVSEVVVAQSDETNVGNQVNEPAGSEVSVPSTVDQAEVGNNTPSQAVPVRRQAPRADGSTASADQVKKLMDKHPNGIPGSLLKQIKITAKKRNVDVPEFQSLDEAQAFFATLVLPQAELSMQRTLT